MSAHQYRLFTIQPDGTINEEILAGPKPPKLKLLQQRVGGWIETIPYFTQFVHNGKAYKRGAAFANEEGIIKDLPFNISASRAWKNVFPHATPLHGPVVIYFREKLE